MINDRPGSTAGSSKGFVQRWSRFWFTPVETALLHRLRLGAGMLFFLWLLSFAGNQHALFSLKGWFDVDAYRELSSRQEAERLQQQEKGTPPTLIPPAPIGWSIFYLVDGNSGLFDVLYWGSVAVVLLFALGVAPRITSVLTWVVVVSATANPATTYDADFLLVIFAFYLMLAYLFLGLREARSWPERILGPAEAMVFARFLPIDKAPVTYSYAANIAMRLIQLHFALILVVSGLANLQSPEWATGVAYWYPLHPPFRMSKETYLRDLEAPNFTLTLLSLAEYISLAWRIMFPAFAWRRGNWRIILVGGGIVAWAWTVGVWGLPLLGPIYLLGTLCYLDANEWRALAEWLPRRTERSARSSASAPKVKVEAR